MVRVLLQMLRFITKFQKKSVSIKIEVEEYSNSENTLIRLIQARTYAEEIQVYKNHCLSSKRKVKTRMWKLDPFLDDNNILRVGGRLNKSSLIESAKHPIILPKWIASRRLAESFHQSVQHSGRTTTVSEIRQSGFWIVNVNLCIRSIIHHCVRCRLFRGKMGEQKMANLPDQRITCEGPFVYSGVDMFGPFHIETTIDMSTSSFINALRRFLARRGM